MDDEAMIIMATRIEMMLRESKITGPEAVCLLECLKLKLWREVDQMTELYVAGVTK